MWDPIYFTIGLCNNQLYFLFLHCNRQTKANEGDIVLTLDAGDWYSGSLFDNLGAEAKTISVPQLEFFHAAGYDGIILGNHDFDRYESALLAMLEKACQLRLSINVLVSNLLPISKDSKFQQFYDPSSSVQFMPYLIKETQKGRIGVLGYMTPDALFVSNDYRSELQFIGYTFEDGNQYDKLLQLAERQSTMLKTDLKCDIVIAVIHGGHLDKEDVGFLNLPNIDIVLGGHTHESYFYSTEDSSLTSQCGNSGTQLTALSVAVDKDKKLHFNGVANEYSSLVTRDYPQCILVQGSLESDGEFDKKIDGWKREMKDLLGLDQDRIVFKGNLTTLFQRSSTQDENARAFAHMLVDQFNIWEQNIKPDSTPVTVTFWNKDFFGNDQLSHDLWDVTLTFDDAYSLIFLPATKNLYSFYLRKEDIYYILQGMFFLNKMVSPLLTVSPGGILYDETTFFEVPLITNIRTINDVIYKEWPSLVRVLVNSVSAPYFWKLNAWSYGMVDISPRDERGNKITMDTGMESDSPKELDLFLHYLKSLN